MFAFCMALLPLSLPPLLKQCNVTIAMAAKPYKVVSLFSGGMGLDVGLEQTGRFRVIACVEVEHAFVKTIHANKEAGRLHRDLQVFERDIRRVAPEEIMAATGLRPGEVDLLVGGPPCQSFSTAGRRRTITDTRGTLLWEYLRFIAALRPRFFLMENVRGLLSAAVKHRPIALRPENGGPPLSPDEEPGSVIRRFANDLQSIEGSPYHVDCFLVNAVNYGAPQIRERALFIGNRYGAEVAFPGPTHGPTNGAAGNGDGSSLLPWMTLGDAIGHLEDRNPVVMDFSPRKKRYLAMVPPGGNWRSLSEEVQRDSMGRAWCAKGGRSGWWRRLNFDLPCPTLVTMPNHSGTALCHPVETRALTVKEYAAIQEFPPGWSICGKPSEQYAQIGNAVPVRLGMVAGNVIAEEMARLRLRHWRPYSSKVDAYRVLYIQAHVRRRRWFRNGQVLVWDGGDGNEDVLYSPPKTLRKQGVLFRCGR